MDATQMLIEALEQELDKDFHYRDWDRVRELMASVKSEQELEKAKESMLTKAHSLCLIKDKQLDYHYSVEYLVTGRATVRTRGENKYIYEGHTFDLVAVMTIHRDTGVSRVSELFPPGTKEYVISLIGTEFETSGYMLANLDERDLEIHEVSGPIYRETKQIVKI